MEDITQWHQQQNEPTNCLCGLALDTNIYLAILHRQWSLALNGNDAGGLTALTAWLLRLTHSYSLSCNVRVLGKNLVEREQVQRTESFNVVYVLVKFRKLHCCQYIKNGVPM